ncbi:MAG: hypothetical protein EOO16_11075 [Chitinophagaceae bacterium]|nr:MAG: hypothetical protein EOO16_11075 [Chitinophagaceae bacterium]
MRALNYLFMVLFILSAALQYNDPDPYLWMPIYLFGAFLCYQAARGIVRPVLYAIGIGFYTLYAAYLFFDRNGVLSWAREHDRESLVQSMKATKPWIEETREFLGLGLLIGMLLLNWIVYRRRQHRQAATVSAPRSTSNTSGTRITITKE